MKKVEVDIGDYSCGGDVLEEVDSLGVAKREDEDQRRYEDSKSTIQVEIMTEQSIAGEGEEESIPLIT